MVFSDQSTINNQQEYKMDATEPNCFLVRINIKQQNPATDYSLFMNDMEIINEAKWDKDHKGKIKIGDYIGFIVGKAGETVVHIFQVKSDFYFNFDLSFSNSKTCCASLTYQEY